MSKLEGREELSKNIIFGLLALNNIRMLVGLVYTSDIVDIDPAVSIGIKFFESLSDDSLSCHVHWSSDGSDELIVGDGTR